MNKKELGKKLDGHGTKITCTIDKRHCGNEREVRRMLEREANERYRKRAECTLFIWGCALVSNIQKRVIMTSSLFPAAPSSSYLSLSLCLLSDCLTTLLLHHCEEIWQSSQEQVGTERKQRIKMIKE